MPKHGRMDGVCQWRLMSVLFRHTDIYMVSRCLMFGHGCQSNITDSLIDESFMGLCFWTRMVSISIGHWLCLKWLVSASLIVCAVSQLYWHLWGVFLETDGGFCVQALWIRMVSVFLSRLPWTRMILVVWAICMGWCVWALWTRREPGVCRSWTWWYWFFGQSTRAGE